MKSNDSEHLYYIIFYRYRFKRTRRSALFGRFGIILWKSSSSRLKIENSLLFKSIALRKNMDIMFDKCICFHVLRNNKIFDIDVLCVQYILTPVATARGQYHAYVFHTRIDIVYSVLWLISNLILTQKLKKI